MKQSNNDSFVRSELSEREGHKTHTEADSNFLSKYFFNRNYRICKKRFQLSLWKTEMEHFIMGQID